MCRRVGAQATCRAAAAVNGGRCSSHRGGGGLRRGPEGRGADGGAGGGQGGRGRQLGPRDGAQAGQRGACAGRGQADEGPSAEAKRAAARWVLVRAHAPDSAPEDTDCVKTVGVMVVGSVVPATREASGGQRPREVGAGELRAPAAATSSLHHPPVLAVPAFALALALAETVIPRRLRPVMGGRAARLESGGSGDGGGGRGGRAVEPAASEAAQRPPCATVATSRQASASRGAVQRLILKMGGQGRLEGLVQGGKCCHEAGLGWHCQAE